MKSVSCDYLINLASQKQINSLILVRAGTDFQKVMLIGHDGEDLAYCIKDVLFLETYLELIKAIVDAGLHLESVAELAPNVEVRLYSRAELHVQD